MNSLRESAYKRVINGTVNIIESIMNEYCEELGTLDYRCIRHNYDGLYKDLDILTKKVIHDKINNTIIIDKYGRIDESLILVHKGVDIEQLFISNESNRMKKTIKYNSLLLGNTMWIKLYNKGKEIDFIYDIADIKVLEKYFNDQTIKFAIRNKLCIPYVDFNNNKMVEVTLARIREEINFSKMMSKTF